MEIFKLETRGKILNIIPFDKDKEIEVKIYVYDTDSTNYFYITPNQTNELITHLVGYLKEINEPIELLYTQDYLLDALQYTLKQLKGLDMNNPTEKNIIEKCEKAIEKALK